MSRTKKAVQRARRMAPAGSRVLAYAGTRAGSAGIEKSGADDWTASVGSFALLDLLQEDEQAAVLHIHDDVHLTAGSLRRMLAQGRDGDALLVPYSNDIGTEHYTGPLPMGANAQKQMLDASSRLPETRVVHRVSTSCVLGPRELVLGLVPLHIAFPGNIVDITTSDVRACGGAVAAHDGECHQRRHEPVGPAGRPLLVASMIVRDEEEMLPGCLETLEGVVDEIVICDTGSVDETVAIAEAANAQVIHRRWRNDFAWARNEALAESLDAWYVLQIDADERLSVADVDGFRRALATAVDEYDQFRILMRNPVSGDERHDTVWWSPRIFSPGKMHFEGELHEAPTPRPPRTGATVGELEGLHLTHLGYDPAIMASRAKGQRNLEIVRTAYESNPSLHNTLHYARTLGMVNEDKDLQIELFEDVLEQAAGGMRADALCYVQTRLGELYLDRGDAERAFDLTRHALEQIPGDRAAATVHARAASRLARHDAVVALSQRRSEPSLKPLVETELSKAALDSFIAASRIALGDTEGGLATAMDVLQDAPAAFSAWPELVRELLATYEPDDALDLLLDPALTDTTGRVFKAVTPELPPSHTLEFCVRYLRSGGSHPEAVRVGLVAAMIRDDFSALELLLDRAVLLPGPVRDQISDRLRSRGHDAVASALDLVHEAPATTGTG